ncbi:MAG TPA: 4Fe-4S binding protein [Leptolinea sp.]
MNIGIPRVFGVAGDSISVCLKLEIAIGVWGHDSFMSPWRGVMKVEPLSKSVSQNNDKCVHCGACTAFCPTGALAFEIPSLKVLFDAEKCNGCELCVSACPVRAMEINLL